MLARIVVLAGKVAAVHAVALGRSKGWDDLMIIEVARMSGEQEGRGGEIFAREVARLVHETPSEGDV